MKISLVLAYFGQWPPWFPAFLLSCQHNPGINWLIFTDCEPPPTPIANVSFVPFSLQAFQGLAGDKLGFPVTHDQPYKLCDFKPAYGLIFQEYLAGCDFWGHCDLDVVWGDIRKFITDDILRQHDVISARKHMLCGHFNLYRNDEKINSMFTLVPQYREILSHEKTVSFDEVVMTMLVEELVRQGFIRVYWPRYVLDDEFVNVLRAQPSGWHWRDGRLYNGNKDDEEIMYLHFSEWKDTLGGTDFGVADSPPAFTIARDGIHRVGPR